MAFISTSHLAFVFGILGDIVSFLVYLAPLPTFYRICRKKSTEEFQAIPYSVALFSSMLTLYYGLLKTNGILIIVINSIGCAIESIYLALFLLYAPAKIRINTVKLLAFLNLGVFGLILLSTSFAAPKISRRETVVGWICAVFSICVFAAPLSIMRHVIRTKSVEFMPFPLSFFLTLCAVMWFFYGLLVDDYFIASPNILGFLFGIAQMVLYVVYKDSKKDELPEFKLQEMPPNGTVQVSVVTAAAPATNGDDVGISATERNINDDVTIV